MAIVFSVSAILCFRLCASNSDDVLGYIYFLKMALNYLVSNDVVCFTSECNSVIVLVEDQRYASPGGYKSPPVKEAL